MGKKFRTKKEVLEIFRNKNENYPIYLGSKIEYFYVLDEDCNKIKLDEPVIDNTYYREVDSYDLDSTRLVLYYGGNIDFNKKSKLNVEDLSNLLKNKDDNFKIYVADINEKTNLEVIDSFYIESSRVTFYGDGNLKK